MSRQAIMELVEQYNAEQATGCSGAGGYRNYAKSQGYPHCEVVEWTSSAGDWTFVVSRDGQEWHIMYQENNYPRGYGFTRTIDVEQTFYGTAEEVLAEIVALYW